MITILSVFAFLRNEINHCTKCHSPPVYMYNLVVRVCNVCDRESQANILLDKRPRGESKVSGGVFQGAPAGSQFQHQVEAGKD